MLWGSVEDLRKDKAEVLWYLDLFVEYRSGKRAARIGRHLEADRMLERFLVDQLWLRRKYGMPAKKFDNTTFKGFVNYKPTEEDYERFQAWDIHDGDLFLLLSEIVSSGYKQGTSYNADNQTFNATLICGDKDSPNYNYGMSAFAPSWYDALRLLIYKHTVIFAYEWDVQASNKNASKWG